MEAIIHSENRGLQVHQIHLDPSVCKVCHNLNLDSRPKWHRPLTMNEDIIQLPFTDLQKSAEAGKCKIREVIHVGIIELDTRWVEDGEPSMIQDSTTLLLVVRRGHSLRVSLCNVSQEVTLEFFTESVEDAGPMPVFGVARMVPERLDLSRCVRLASEWIKNCDENHPACHLKEPTRFPKRLLDVRRTATDKNVYLAEFLGSVRHHYVTLSHCWEPNPVIRTITSTKQKMIDGFSIQKLPRTFRDAVRITRGLGLRYIWIDSLCIVQDSPSDWDVESMKMGDYYQGAVLNLAVTHSSNSEGGCFANRWSMDTLNQFQLGVGEDYSEAIVPDDNEDDSYRILVRYVLHVAHDQFTRSMDYTSTIPDSSPLLNRAWVFQERLLSRRSLHFHAEELVWECSSGLSCECSRLDDYKLGDPDSPFEQNTADQVKTIYNAIFLGKASQSEIVDSWLTFVSEYCSLKLTISSDRLPALSGLASRISVPLQSSYLAGLWSQDLPRQLCWAKESISRPSLRLVDHGAPSWSWASVALDNNARISAPNITYDLISTLGFHQDSRFRVLDVNCTPNGANTFGTCSEAHLKVEGALIDVTYAFRLRSDNVNDTLVSFANKDEHLRADCIGSNRLIPGLVQGEPLRCLLVGYSEKQDDKRGVVAYLLVLRQVTELETYDRVGMIDCNEGTGLLDGMRVGIVNII